MKYFHARSRGRYQQPLAQGGAVAVLIQGYSVVVRKAMLAAMYPGGTDASARDCPNSTFCADEHVSRVGFMQAGDAERFMAELAAKGLTPTRDGRAEDVALTAQDYGFVRPCDWLELARSKGTPIACSSPPRATSMAGRRQINPEAFAGAGRREGGHPGGGVELGPAAPRRLVAVWEEKGTITGPVNEGAGTPSTPRRSSAPPPCRGRAPRRAGRRRSPPSRPPW